jgi:hypothetical protein
MSDGRADRPTDRELADGLGRVLAVGRPGSLEIVDRGRNYYASTFVSEIVHVRSSDGDLTVFCKHGYDYLDAVAGQWRGVAYEAAVYERVIAPHKGPAPTYLGRFEGGHGITIVLEHRPDALRLHDTAAGTASAIVRAAGLLGQWHARARRVSEDPSTSLLQGFGKRRLDAWKERLSAQAHVDDAHMHLAAAVEATGTLAALAGAPDVIQHGELFTSNVLVDASGRIDFVDWETCAHGPGEIDLAHLTIGNWPAETVAACERSYSLARFGAQAPSWFAPALDCARLFVLSQIAVERNHRGGDAWTDRSFRDQVQAIAEGVRK